MIRRGGASQLLLASSSRTSLQTAVSRLRYWVRTLGGLSLHESGLDGPELLGTSKSLALLVYLSTSEGAGRREHLASLLWPGTGSRGRRSLRQAIYYLSKQAGAPLLEADDGWLRVDTARARLDLEAFHAALDEERWEDAVDLHGGPFLAGFDREVSGEFEHWVEAQRERIWSGLKVALHRLVSEAHRAGDAEEAVRRARRLVDLNPLDEAAQAALITAHTAGGDRIAALQAYEAYRALVARELGDEPGPELARQVDRIRGAVLRPVTPVPETEARSETEVPSERQVEGPSEEEADAPAGATSDSPGSAPDVDVDATPGAEAAPAREAATPGAEATPGVAAAPAGGSAPAGEARRKRPWLPVAIGLAAGLLLAAAALGIWRRAVSGEPPTSALLVERAGDDVLWEVRVGADGGVRLAPTDWRRGERPSPEGELAAGTIRSPDGPDVVVRRADAGTAAATATGTTPEAGARRLTDRADDEAPVAWSPDGRRLLYRRGFLHPETGRWTVRLAALALETGTDRLLSELPFAKDGGADWDPTGTRIAFSGATAEGDTAIHLVRPDGSGLRRLLPPARRSDPSSQRPDSSARRPDSAGGELAPAWSPDGRRLAFVVRDREGRGDVYVVRRNGEDLLRITQTPEDERDPAWLPDGRLVYIRRTGDRGELVMRQRADAWAEAVRLAEGDFHRIVGGRARPGDPEGGAAGTGPRWIREVRLSPRVRTASPGQWVRLSPRIRDAEGRTVPPERVPLRWTVTEGLRLRDVYVPGHEPASAERWLHVEGPGTARVGIEVPGWRADTLRIASRPVRVREGRLLFREDWAGGSLEPDRWIVHGLPRPAVERLTADAVPVRGWETEFSATLPAARPGRMTPAPGAAGPNAGAPDAAGPRNDGSPRNAGGASRGATLHALVSHGDESYESGVTSRRSFPLDSGLTVEVWGRIPLTGRNYETFVVALAGEPVEEGDEVGYETGALWFGFRMGDGVAVLRRGKHHVPPPDDPGSWHRYALQVSPDGDLALFVDGRLHWRSAGGETSPKGERSAGGTPPATRPPPDRVHVVLSGRTVPTTIHHGPVRVWRGPRYIPAGDPSSVLAAGPGPVEGWAPGREGTGRERRSGRDPGHP